MSLLAIFPPGSSGEVRHRLQDEVHQVVPAGARRVATVNGHPATSCAATGTSFTPSADILATGSQDQKHSGCLPAERRGSTSCSPAARTRSTIPALRPEAAAFLPGGGPTRRRAATEGHGLAHPTTRSRPPICASTCAASITSKPASLDHAPYVVDYRDGEVVRATVLLLLGLACARAYRQSTPEGLAEYRLRRAQHGDRPQRLARPRCRFPGGADDDAPEARLRARALPTLHLARTEEAITHYEHLARAARHDRRSVARATLQTDGNSMLRRHPPRVAQDRRWSRVSARSR